MTGEVLLDTNVVIGLFAADSSVLSGLASVSAAYVPAIVLGELYFGALKSARAEANVTRILEFAAASEVLVCDGSTAENYGQIKDGLRSVGRPIPENDIWIAAVAMQHGLAVATRDSHFGEVAGLEVIAW